MAALAREELKHKVEKLQRDYDAVTSKLALYYDVQDDDHPIIGTYQCKAGRIEMTIAAIEIMIKRCGK